MIPLPFPSEILEDINLFKIIFILLILLGAAAYFPQTRPVVVETLGPLMNPVLIWQTKGEMNRIARELQTLQREGDGLPVPGASFQRWMTMNFLGRVSTDAWGTTYSMKVGRDSVRIVSNGPDLEIETTDDLQLGAVAVVLQRRR